MQQKRDYHIHVEFSDAEKHQEDLQSGTIHSSNPLETLVIPGYILVNDGINGQQQVAYSASDIKTVNIKEEKVKYQIGLY